MNDLGVELFIDYKKIILEKSRDLTLNMNCDKISNELLQQLRQFEKEWTELHKQYQSLICYGYKQNEKFLCAKQVMDKMKQHQIIDKLNDSDKEERSRNLLLIYLREFEIYLEDVQLDWQGKDPKRPFLVDLWTGVLRFLEKLSVFYFIRNFLWKDYTKGNYRFVDGWLLGHTLLAFFYIIIANIEAMPMGVKYALLIYGCLRMFEILIYQLNVILVHPYSHSNYSLNSYRRMTIALIHNFIEIIFWFAGTFETLQFISDTTIPMAVYTSFTHMVTYTMELDESKWTIITVFILQFQALIGVFMTVLSLARFVSLFPQPASLDPKEQEANEVRHTLIIEKLQMLEQKVENNVQRISANSSFIEEIREKQKDHCANNKLEKQL